MHGFGNMILAWEPVLMQSFKNLRNIKDNEMKKTMNLNLKPLKRRKQDIKALPLKAPKHLVMSPNGWVNCLIK